MPLIKSARKKQTARDKCDGILDMFEILATNHLPELYEGIDETKQIMADHKEEAQKRSKKMLLMAVVILLALLTQNPALLGLISKLWFLIF